MLSVSADAEATKRDDKLPVSKTHHGFATATNLPKETWMKQKTKASDFPGENTGICSIFSVKST